MRTHSGGECDALIEIVSLTKHIAGRKAVDNLSFEVCAGEVLGIVGPNGAGKSTALKMLAGSVEPSVGYARILGYDVQAQPLQARRLMGYMPEEEHCYAGMSVMAFLKFIARIRGVQGARQRSRIDEVVGQLQLESVLRQPLGALSKSYNRLVGLAQSVLHEPQVLILDDPTDGLDCNQQHQVRSLIKRQSADKTIILATRLLEEVTTLCSRALIVANGRLRADGTPLELQSLSRYRQAVTVHSEQPLDLLALAVLPGVAGIEADQRTPGAITILAKPSCMIFPNVHQLIVARNWKIKSLTVERGRLDDVFRQLTQPCQA